ncbi:MAG: hypothetical protein HYT72_02920 [Candidatus Aenigmarchaeota archaeon]|nr:hypothetical protein [Candidatus Aenigmarchaeota archaeon]
MPTIRIIDDILAPAETVKINYEGKNPYTPVLIIPQLLRDVMKITGQHIREIDTRWDITSDPRPFYALYEGRRTEDRWTKTMVRFIAQGVQSSKDKTGWVRLQFKGNIMTEYEYANFIQKSFWWLFNYTFYYKQRRRYIEMAKDNIHTMKARMQSALGILRE